MITLTQKNWGQFFVVVTGEKGVGKTCLIGTAVNNKFGIIHVPVLPTHSQEDAIQNTLRKVTKLRINVLDPEANAKRVLFWYRLILRTTPIVVMNVAERKDGTIANLTGAVRYLTDELGLRVIVDSSPNSLDESLLHSLRSFVVRVGPMTKEMIWSMRHLGELFDIIKQHKMDDIVWRVLGGIPGAYSEFWHQLKYIHGPHDRSKLENLLCSNIATAITIVNTGKNKNKQLQDVIALLDKEKLQIDLELILAQGIVCSSPDKVFKLVLSNGVPVLVPASSAISIVLVHNLRAVPTFTQLESLVLS